MTVTLHYGDEREVLLEVEVDHQIADPPYGARTHEGHNACSESASDGFDNPLDYDNWTPDHVHAFVRSWSHRVRGWMVEMSSHDLIPAWEAAFEETGRYCFAPIPYVDMGKGPRVLGDGPASWTCFLMVARPRSIAWLTDWRTRREALDLPCSLPGAYLRERGDTVWKPPESFGKKRIGGKPLGLLRALVRDYTLPGDIVADPYAGHATLLRACDELGRHAVGAERDRAIWEAAMYRLAQPVALGLFADGPGKAAEKPPEQGVLTLFDG